MRIIPEKIYKEMEKNIFHGTSLTKVAIVILWTLAGLLFVNKRASNMYGVLFGILFYISLLALCLLLFRDIKKYLEFPKNSKILPCFIGYKLDIIVIYPLILMSIIGAINNILIASGLFPKAFQDMNTVLKPIEFIGRIMILPFVAFAEELFNVLLVSILCKKIRLPGNFRLAASILSAALTFGILHSIGWGLNTAILLGLSYIPVFFATLYTGSIWISSLAHLYNDLISVSKTYYGSFHYVIIAAICLIPFVWAIKTMVRKTN